MHVVMRDERTVLVKCRHEYESWLVVFIRQFFFGGGAVSTVSIVYIPDFSRCLVILYSEHV